MLLSFAATAHAQPGLAPVEAPRPPVERTQTERYVLSVAAADAVAAGLVIFGIKMISDGFDAMDVDSEANRGDQIGLGFVSMFAGLGVYVFGAPLVHAAKDNGSSMWKSLALRLGLPLLGTAVGGDSGGVLGGLGMGAAIVIDWSVLAKREVPRAVPYAAPIAGGGTTFGLAGAF